MRLLIRYFFKTVRLIATPFVLLAHRMRLPTPVERSEEQQREVDRQTRALALYHFNTCPFCLKVRRRVHGLALDIELRDAQHDPQARRELAEQGGRVKVPCLKITGDDGKTTWLYESSDINQYLQERFA